VAARRGFEGDCIITVEFISTMKRTLRTSLEPAPGHDRTRQLLRLRYGDCEEVEMSLFHAGTARQNADTVILAEVMHVGGLLLRVE
jgi:hypothetical protein